MKELFLSIALLFCICSVVLASSYPCTTNPDCPETITAASDCSATSTTICPTNNVTYFQCMSLAAKVKIWIQVSCLSGSTFNCDTNQCSGGSQPPTVTPPTLVPKPGVPGGPGIRPTRGRSVCYRQTNGTKIAYPNITTLYFLCVNGKASIWQCPSNGIFNGTTQSCQGGSGSGSTNPGTVTCPLGVNTLLPAPNNCQYYYSCSNGVGTLVQCPSGYYFTTTVSACTMNKPSNCGSSTIATNYPSNVYYPAYQSNFEPNYYPIYELGNNYPFNYWRRNL